MRSSNAVTVTTPPIIPAHLDAYTEVFGGTAFPSAMWANESHPSASGYDALAALMTAALPADLGSGTVAILSDSWGIQGATNITTAITGSFPSASVVDASVSGNRLDQMIARFDADVAAHDPDVCVHFSCFANDIYRGRTEAQIKTDIATLVGLCRTEGCELLLFGVAPFSEHAATSATLAPIIRNYVGAYG